MSSVYYESVDRMQKQGVDPEYVNGWAMAGARANSTLMPNSSV